MYIWIYIYAYITDVLLSPTPCPAQLLKFQEMIICRTGMLKQPWLAKALYVHVKNGNNMPSMNTSGSQISLGFNRIHGLLRRDEVRCHLVFLAKS